LQERVTDQPSNPSTPILELGDVAVRPDGDGFSVTEALGAQHIAGPFPTRAIAEGIAHSVAAKRRARCWFKGSAFTLLPGSLMKNELTQHIELLNAYHLDLWSEVEAQLRVIKAAQEQIQTLRDLRQSTDGIPEARASAAMLGRHVETLKGRAQALTATIKELEGTVAVLVKVLAE
jgi:hypothetical protein